MASPLFKTSHINVSTGASVSTPSFKVNTTNDSGGVAYAMTHEHALAQYAVTGMLDSLVLQSAEVQFERVLQISQNCSSEYIAKLAIYAHEKGLMKDMPALLLAILLKRDKSFFEPTFDRVITNGRMLRTFVNVVRSGRLGFRSFGSLAKRKIQQWLNSASDKTVINASIGKSPSLKDIILMVHPKAPDEKRNQLYRWVCDMDCQEDKLPEQLQLYLKLKRNLEAAEKLPDVPFQMYTSMGLTTEGWKHIAKNATWNQTRMNLATFERHGVLSDREMESQIAERLKSHRDILGSKAMPYSIFSAYKAANGSELIKRALNTAAEMSLDNVPEIKGKTVIAIDISGSMTQRVNMKSNVTCMDIAGLFASALMSKNKDVDIILFNTSARRYIPRYNRILDITMELASMSYGGTDCSSAMEYVRNNYTRDRLPDNIIMISDNESWADAKNRPGYTGTYAHFLEIKKNNPRARMVNLDIAPHASAQTVSGSDVLNIGGFTDSVFQVMAMFFESKGNPDFWVNQIKSIQL
jgi:60 kDa SS-A/Ro ribonucleoprotein